LSPSDPHVFFFDMALIMPHLMGGDYASAIDVGRRAIELNPWFSSAYKGYLASLGHMGRTREAAEVLRRLLDLEPGFSIQQAMLRSPLVRPEDIVRYAEGLRRAGLPENGGVMKARAPTVLTDQPTIDLVSASSHSPAARRDDPHTNGGLRE
jgi:tetratricopeptide (TPR) repeat protein